MGCGEFSPMLDRSLLLDVLLRLCRELGDDALTPRCIPTELRVGYRMERPESRGTKPEMTA